MKIKTYYKSLTQDPEDSNQYLLYCPELDLYFSELLEFEVPCTCGSHQKL